MGFEGLDNNEISKTELTPEMENLLRRQMQMALAFSNLPMDRTPKEEEAIMIARIQKNSRKFNIVFDEMVKNNPNLLEDWHENSNEILDSIQEQMNMIPALPEEKLHLEEELEEKRKAA